MDFEYEDNREVVADYDPRTDLILLNANLKPHLHKLFIDHCEKFLTHEILHQVLCHIEGYETSKMFENIDYSGYYKEKKGGGYFVKLCVDSFPISGGE